MNLSALNKLKQIEECGCTCDLMNSYVCAIHRLIQELINELRA